MRTLTAVQILFAIGYLGLGVVALFGLGITGLFIMMPGAVFAAIAAVLTGQSRAAVLVALGADAVMACFCAARLQASLLEPAPSTFELLLPAAILALIAAGLVGVMLDWRTMRDAAWF